MPGQPFEIPALEEICKTKFTSNNDVKLLYTGLESFDAIFRGIDEAGSYICLHFYIFRNDSTGTELARRLVKKARDGVSIYIIYDHFGSFGTPRSFWEDLKKEGIKISSSRPFIWRSPFRYLYRDHRKLVIIDGLKAFTGGFNIGDEYRGRHLPIRRTGWRDTGVMLQGPVINDLMKTFQKSWKKGDWPPLTPYPAECFTNCLSVIPVFSASARERRRLRKLLYYSITNARKEIMLTTAYFVPSRRMLDILEEAVMRGVKVRLLLQGKSDIPIVYYAGRKYFARLLDAGVKIYTYQSEILHAKTYVFDGHWSIVGSANLDFRSLRINDEGNVGILDPTFGKTMTDLFNDDLSRSVEITPDTWRRRGLYQRIMETVSAAFSRRL